MSFTSLQSLMEAAAERQISISEMVIQLESENTGISVETIKNNMAEALSVMKKAVSSGLEEGVISVSGLTGGNATKMNTYRLNSKPLNGALSTKAMTYALACSEINASMGIIVAAPTAGSCGILPGVILACGEELECSDEDLIRALFTASGIGAVIATRATLSGAEGGCQAECGSAAAMAAAAACELCGQSAEVCMQAASLALKNVLGLACDPVCGLVEVPCVKRNGVFASIALTAADLAMAGITSVIPPDEVIDAMYAIGSSLPSSLRETACGGLAVTPTGLKLKEKMHNSTDLTDIK